MNIANPVGNAGERYPVTSGFGWRVHPVTGDQLYHFGIDISAPEGTNVRSADLGEVTVSKLSPSAGNMVKIVHPNGFTSVYMHMLVRHVNIGDLVRAGDIIGNVGHTGVATGNHLHFEIYDPSGERFDPAECYDNAVDIIPYQYAPGEDPIDPDKDPGKIPTWLWWVGGGVLALGTVSVIVAASRDRK